jgi:predicted HTH transcriptional regulator
LANEQNYTATANISGGKAINGVSDNGTGGTYTGGTAVSRPNTSGITTN